MAIYLQVVGKGHRIEEVVDAAVTWGAGLAADMPLPNPAFTPDVPEVPVALALLVDRLDCPSRMVQERAAWHLAERLADRNTREATVIALSGWHDRAALELRTSKFLLVLRLASTAFGASEGTCIEIATKASLVPSLSAGLLLEGFGEKGAKIADSLYPNARHLAGSSTASPGLPDFRILVGAHLAPAFNTWAQKLDESVERFSCQWRREAAELAKQEGLSLRLNDRFPHHYQGGADGPWLAISDRVSDVLRSAFIRALHWAVDEAGLVQERARAYARRVGIMADPEFWAVRPNHQPAWWPEYSDEGEGLQRIAEAVGSALRARFEHRKPDESEVVCFAAGPVGGSPHFQAEVVVRAYLQSAFGPFAPRSSEFSEIPWVSCRPIPPRETLSGTYMTFAPYVGPAGDWLVAPLAWWFQPDTHVWLHPDRQRRGLHLPATWLFPGAPMVQTETNRVAVKIGDQAAAQFHYWHDDLRERHYHGAGSRVGAELILRREWLEPHLSAGATLCWTASLLVSERERYKSSFNEPTQAGYWLFGGSRMVWHRSWRPPHPGEDA